MLTPALAEAPMIDKAKLKSLRDLYQNAKGGEMHDPRFRKIAKNLFRDGDRRKWPFADVARLLDAPYRPDAPALADFADLEIALIGVPMDLGVTNRAGARLGPRAVRAVERIGPYEHVLKIAPLAERRIADIGDAPMRSRYSLESCHEDIESFYRRVVEAGVVPLSVGGDHSISYPILKAVGAKRPVGMLHIDAHCDTGGPFEGSKFHHGGPFRQAVLDGVLDPERVVQIGIRGGAEYLWEFSYASGMTVIHAEELVAMGLEAAIAKARAVIGAGPAYLTFDIDSLDPGFAPGTGTPEVGGLAPGEALSILRGCSGLDFVGGDVVEVAPQYDATSNTAQCAAQMLFTMLALMCEAAARRGSAPGSPRRRPGPRKPRRPRRN
jgi:guanidinopropionase